MSVIQPPEIGGSTTLYGFLAGPNAFLTLDEAPEWGDIALMALGRGAVAELACLFLVVVIAVR